MTFNVTNSAIQGRKPIRKPLYFLLGLIILMDESFWFTTSGIAILSTIKNVTFVIMPFLLYLSFGRINLTSKQLILVLSLCLIIIISSLVNENSFVGGPLLLIGIIITGLLFTNKISLWQFSECFTRIMYVLTLYSLAIFVLLFVGILHPNVIYNISNVPTLTFGGCVYFPTGVSGSLYRNSGVYREPGVFQIYINMAIACQLLVLKVIDKKTIAVLSMGVLSTFSTTGAIVFAFIFLLYFIAGNKTKSSYFYGLAIFLLILYVFSSSYGEETFNKLDAGLDNKSTLARVSSITVPAEMFLESPIIGYGMNGYEDEYDRVLFSQYHVPFGSAGLATNTLMTAFSVWGIFVGGYYLIGLFLFSKLVCRGNNRQAIMFFVAILMLLFSEAILYSPFLQILIMYGYAKKQNVFTK